jgi:hypothetical protein
MRGKGTLGSLNPMLMHWSLPRNNFCKEFVYAIPSKPRRPIRADCLGANRRVNHLREVYSSEITIPSPAIIAGDGTKETLLAQDINLDDIRLHRNNDPIEFDDLMKNIKEFGLVKPITVTRIRVNKRSTGEVLNKFFLLDGRRRFEACKALGHKTIKAEII